MRLDRSRLVRAILFVASAVAGCTTDAAPPSTCEDCAPIDGKADAVALDWDAFAEAGTLPALAMTLTTDVWLATPAVATDYGSDVQRSAFLVDGQWQDDPPLGRVACTLTGRTASLGEPFTAPAGGPLMVSYTKSSGLSDSLSGVDYFSGVALFLAENPERLDRLVCSAAGVNSYPTFREIQTAVGEVLALEARPTTFDGDLYVSPLPATRDEAGEECNRLGFSMPSQLQFEIRGENAIAAAGLPDDACAWSLDRGVENIPGTVQRTGGTLVGRVVERSAERTCHTPSASAIWPTSSTGAITGRRSSARPGHRSTACCTSSVASRAKTACHA